MMLTYKRANPAWLKDLARKIEDVGKVELAVGFPSGVNGVSSPHYENGASILEVAVYNNFGIGVPRRAFFEQSKGPIQAAWHKRLKEQKISLYSGRARWRKFLQLVGIESQKIVQKKITDGPWLPNAPATIARKGSDKPLIDTGAMRQNVTFVVRARRTKA